MSPAQIWWYPRWRLKWKTPGRGRLHKRNAGADARPEALAEIHKLWRHRRRVNELRRSGGETEDMVAVARRPLPYFKPGPAIPSSWLLCLKPHRGAGYNETSRWLMPGDGVAVDRIRKARGQKVVLSCFCRGREEDRATQIRGADLKVAKRKCGSHRYNSGRMKINSDEDIVRSLRTQNRHLSEGLDWEKVRPGYATGDGHVQ
ncbi:hypothetical protein EVAR_84141_1 [Eumeta japonica]|uniref:Uncharacterized protein n=1 Tax=Eumeta variegata TaxID=151549 RepID=A0A4C2A9U3_EUMVA|nr:hypothetical protein EVAR_84141_1 [Eumeta japonica]